MDQDSKHHIIALFFPFQVLPNHKTEFCIGGVGSFGKGSYSFDQRNIEILLYNAHFSANSAHALQSFGQTTWRMDDDASIWKNAIVT